MRRAVVLLLALALGAPEALAQPAPPPHAPNAPGNGPAPAPAPAPNAQRREEIKKKIRSLRAYALTTELSLDEKTGGRLWPVLAKYDDELDKLLQQRVDVNRRLRAADQLTDAKAQDRLIDEAIANQKAFWSVEERRIAELRKILTPAQTARLLVVLPGFERKIQNQLRRAITRRPGPPQGRDGDDDLDDDDDDDGPRRQRRGSDELPRLRRR